MCSVGFKSGKAVTAYKSQKLGEHLSYRAYAKKFNLHLQQELELVEYIKDLTKKGLPPTREMTQKLGEEIAHKHIGDGWVTRFVERNDDYLISRWTTGMDAVRHHADSEAKYDLYFDLLYQKIKEYNVEPAYTYNIDEKGFSIRVIGKQKRIFSKRM
ncbi:hypothetical protein EK21DRAFT_96593 [Setomelanomma holmii]|uniref:HTH CENPB-type domain-containing protein n=1 Tax=Setomelanomma holmii TaxID=210430 RepID=A0A9P4HIY0_9PLEO|nr:hypothetical protein EK21DRAFT_96593 [Setomelanomma holmii]